MLGNLFHFQLKKDNQELKESKAKEAKEAKENKKKEKQKEKELKEEAKKVPFKKIIFQIVTHIINCVGGSQEQGCQK